MHAKNAKGNCSAALEGAKKYNRKRKISHGQDSATSMNKKRIIASVRKGGGWCRRGGGRVVT